MTPHRVFLTGGTGYIGSRLSATLAARGYDVTALARKESQHKLPPNCRVFLGNALDGDSYAAAVAGADTFIHLIGVSHPSPAKARQFVEIDLKSAQEAIRVAATAGIRHFVYLSVAQPAPVMHAYIEARKAGEQVLRASGLNATVLRPWYVLGPGHRWPYVLLPMYAIAKRIPGMRESALRLEPVTLRQMLSALEAAVESPPTGIRVLEVPQIRTANS
ncbi:MAG TPA: NAD(P)H-binding protein [Bryobacteraceae bacterium]